MSISTQFNIFIDPESLPDIDAGILDNGAPVIHLGSRCSVFIRGTAAEFDAFIERLRTAYLEAVLRSEEEKARYYAAD